MSCFLKINLFFLFLFLGSECCNWAEPHQVIFGAQIIKARYYQIKDAGMESLLNDFAYLADWLRGGCLGNFEA